MTVAVVLVALAAFAVVGAVVSGTWLVASLAAILALVLGATATKITHSELMAARVEAARDRALQAQGYRALTDARVAEQTKHDVHMTLEISRRAETISDLEAALTAAHQRAADAVRARADEARRADQAERDGQALAVRLEEAEQRAAEAIVRVHELEAELDGMRSELTAAQAAWNKARTA
ncbi:hypothetical protein SAMN04487968_104230 [Nocardioides terrae]|uniref:Uncharacterized protein n=1 Tax=Nocardioides terrae TaxID=574651 RepID=A0A1I1H7T1_9ACTN|nr:hypothetical protein [Nocardioides terrae]SFC20219.1 hypothetical protein SAMN04487968_104230 [Nocardioides terrae]